MTSEKKSTQLEIACDCILHKIISEKLKPGTPLREDHLAKEFGLSSTPIREAFRKLEQDGWLTSVPYRGSFLRTFTAREIEDIYLLREALETVAVGLAVTRGEPEDFERIDAALRSERDYIAASGDTTSPAPTLEPDMDFHRAICLASHSELLAERSRTLYSQLGSIFLSGSIPSSKQELEAVNEEHMMISGAIRRGWIAEAEALVRRHISSARFKHLNFLAEQQTAVTDQLSSRRRRHRNNGAAQ